MQSTLLLIFISKEKLDGRPVIFTHALTHPFIYPPTDALTRPFITVTVSNMYVDVTFLRAAAGLWAARAADITATSLRAALAAANTKEEEKEEGPDDQEEYSQPV